MIVRGSVLLLIFASTAFAVSEGAHHEPSISELAWPVANFLLFLGLAWKFAWPSIRDGLAERRRVIEREIAEADSSASEARALLDEMQKLRSSEESAAERIREELREEGERARKKLIAGAERSAERIREDARQLGEYEAARTAREIREAVAGDATRRAAEALRSEIGVTEEARFLKELLDGISAGGAQ